VDWLRRSTYAEIGSSAETLDTLAFANHRETHPERFRAPPQDLHESYALLDTIGRAKTTPPLPIQIAIHENSWALIRALNGALEFADEDLHEMARHTGEPVMACECERVCELHDCIAYTQARIDMLAVKEGIEPDPALVSSEPYARPRDGTGACEASPTGPSRCALATLGARKWGLRRRVCLLGIGSLGLPRRAIRRYSVRCRIR
jgi:hypothetical protein